MGKQMWRLLAGTLDFLVVPGFGAPGYRARRRSWSDPALSVDLSGRAFVVTGANAGLGRAMCSALLQRGGAVHMVCRDRGRGEEARAALARETGNDNLHLHLADMAELGSVRALAEELGSLLPGGLHGLIHNAGVLLHAREETSEGHERTFATHVAGPFLLTRALAPALERARPSRVVFVSSGGMYTAKLDPAALEHGPSPYDGMRAYAQAKRAQVVLARHLSKRLAPLGVVVAAMHPGWAKTGGVKRALPRFHRLLRPLLRDPAQGADTAVWLVAAEEAADAGGRFYFDRRARREHIPLSRTRTTPAVEEALVALCERVVEDELTSFQFLGAVSDSRFLGKASDKPTKNSNETVIP